MEISRKYVDRLFNEWVEHGKIIVGVDFDDTISPWKMQEYNPQPTIDTIKEAQKTGAYVMIHTSCHSNRFDEIKEYCDSVGIRVDSINTNPIDLPYGHGGSKPMANIYLDDRAGLTEALMILSSAMYQYRGYLQNKNLDDVG